MAEVDAEYSARLNTFEEENADAQRAYQAFQADEQSKAGWVCCPHCGTAWEGSDACSSVTCGILEQAMGEQRATVGCGKAFNLGSAPKYQPVVLPPPVEAAARPERPVDVSHGAELLNIRNKIFYSLNSAQGVEGCLQVSNVACALKISTECGFVACIAHGIIHAYPQLTVDSF